MNDLSKRTVLAVDDDEYNREIILEALQYDYKVNIAENGEDALDSAKCDPPDIILLDIMMPGMDGYVVCEKLKRNENTKNIPIIFFTSKSDAEYETRGFELGAVDYIIKPIDLNILKARVKTQLSLKRALEKIEMQNVELKKAAKLREDVERITRHDLKTPLNSAIALPEIIMMSDNLTEEQKTMLKNISDSGYKMLRMINSSLDLFKMEQGIYKFSPVEVDLVKVVNKILMEYQAVIESKCLKLSNYIDGAEVGGKDIFLAQGEELLCYSMLSNLIKNALEASPEKEKIRIDFKNNKGAEIKIHNKGAVPKDVREKFFDKYATSGKKEGTGLGTYSANLISKIQGGRISLDTSNEKGTTITIKLKN